MASHIKLFVMGKLIDMNDVIKQRKHPGGRMEMGS